MAVLRHTLFAVMAVCTITAPGQSEADGGSGTRTMWSTATLTANEPATPMNEAPTGYPETAITDDQPTGAGLSSMLADFSDGSTDQLHDNSSSRGREQGRLHVSPDFSLGVLGSSLASLQVNFLLLTNSTANETTMALAPSYIINIVISVLAVIVSGIGAIFSVALYPLKLANQVLAIIALALFVAFLVEDGYFKKSEIYDQGYGPDHYHVVPLAPPVIGSYGYSGYPHRADERIDAEDSELERYSKKNKTRDTTNEKGADAGGVNLASSAEKDSQLSAREDLSHMENYYKTVDSFRDKMRNSNRNDFVQHKYRRH